MLLANFMLKKCAFMFNDTNKYVWNQRETQLCFHYVNDLRYGVLLK